MGIKGKVSLAVLIAWVGVMVVIVLVTVVGVLIWAMRNFN